MGRKFPSRLTSFSHYVSIRYRHVLQDLWRSSERLSEKNYSILTMWRMNEVTKCVKSFCSVLPHIGKSAFQLFWLQSVGCASIAGTYSPTRYTLYRVYTKSFSFSRVILFFGGGSPKCGLPPKKASHPYPHNYGYIHIHTNYHIHTRTHLSFIYSKSRARALTHKYTHCVFTNTHTHRCHTLLPPQTFWRRG